MQPLVLLANRMPSGNRLQEFSPEGLDQQIRVQGQNHDEETGLFYNRYRYYLPHGGRYLTQDPVGLRGGLNNQLYALDNPIENIDTKGLYLLDGAYSASNNQNKIVCDGMSKVMVKIQETPASLDVVDCIKAHENSHLEDGIKDSPLVCAKGGGNEVVMMGEGAEAR